MTRKYRALAMLCAATVALSACDRNKNPKLLNIKASQSGPDEFAVLPNKPLTLPENFSDLPEPAPGGVNRTAQAPLDDAIVALGGNPQAGGSDRGLVGYTTRYGVAADIRGRLAAEDLEFRRQNDGRILERLFNVNVYFKAYSRQALDQHAELARLRRAGVRTVSAPPENLEEDQ